MNTKEIGVKSYMKFITKCIMNNWTVLEPIGDKNRYDCVLERNKILERVQVKTGRYKSGVISFQTRSHHYHTAYKGQKHYKGQIDYFGVYCPELDKSYLVPIQITGTSCLYLRVENTKSGQKKRVHWAKKYEI